MLTLCEKLDITSLVSNIYYSVKDDLEELIDLNTLELIKKTHFTFREDTYDLINNGLLMDYLIEICYIKNTNYQMKKIKKSIDTFNELLKINKKIKTINSKTIFGTLSCYIPNETISTKESMIIDNFFYKIQEIVQGIFKEQYDINLQFELSLNLDLILTRLFHGLKCTIKNKSINKINSIDIFNNFNFIFERIYLEQSRIDNYRNFACDELY